MKIYVASSWRNESQQAVVHALRRVGHDVYDYRNPGPGKVTLDPSDEGADSELRRAVFEQNILALIESDAVVLVQPCGVSAAIELGFAIGRDKYTVVLNAPDGRPELMLRAADQIVTSIEDLVDYFFTLEHTMGTLEDDQAARQC